MSRFQLPILKTLLWCLALGFLPSAFPFSFVALRDRQPLSDKNYNLHPKRDLRVSSIESAPNPEGACRSTSELFSTLGNDREEGIHNENNDCDGQMPRRRVLSSIIAGVLSSGIVNRRLKHAFAENANAATIDLPSKIGSSDQPVVIVGGGGRTGMAVAEAVADPAFGNMHAVTLSRSGRDPFQIVKLPKATKDHLKHRDEPFDVRDPQTTISASLRALSPSVVVYAASASRQGGNSFEVDDAGVEKVALACKEIGAIFVLISALAVDRPNSKSYQITNTLGGNYQGIMDAKYNGEVKARKILSSGNTDYVIVRPGVLLNGKTATGPAGLELNQGDTIGGGLSRDELAGVVVGAIQNRALALNKPRKGGQGITVEAYRKSTAQKLEKQFSTPSGNELTVDASKLVASSSPNTLYRELFAVAKLD